MTTRWHFEQDPFSRTLRLYSWDPERQLQFTIASGGPHVAIMQSEMEEGAAPEVFLEMAMPIAEGFIEGFKRFLGERDDTPKDTVPLHIWAQEADRVNKLIDYATSTPVLLGMPQDSAPSTEHYPSRGA